MASFEKKQGITSVEKTVGVANDPTDAAWFDLRNRVNEAVEEHRIQTAMSKEEEKPADHYYRQKKQADASRDEMDRSNHNRRYIDGRTGFADSIDPAIERQQELAEQRAREKQAFDESRRALMPQDHFERTIPSPLQYQLQQQSQDLPPRDSQNQE